VSVMSGAPRDAPARTLAVASAANHLSAGMRSSWLRVLARAFVAALAGVQVPACWMPPELLKRTEDSAELIDVGDQLLLLALQG